MHEGEIPAGYAAVIRHWKPEITEEAALAAMRALDAAAELERFAANQEPSSNALQFTIIASLVKITPRED